MKIIKYIDNDEINKPQTGNAPVYALENTETTKSTNRNTLKFSATESGN